MGVLWFGKTATSFKTTQIISHCADYLNANFIYIQGKWTWLIIFIEINSAIRESVTKFHEPFLIIYILLFFCSSQLSKYTLLDTALITDCCVWLCKKKIKYCNFNQFQMCGVFHFTRDPFEIRTLPSDSMTVKITNKKPSEIRNLEVV